MSEITATIRVLGAGAPATEIPLGDEPLMIGRDPGCDIVLDDLAVSKKHAQLLQVDGEYMIRDQGSHNGTFVGAERVTHRTLKNGDVIAIGPKKILFSTYEAPSTGGELTLAEVEVGPPGAVAVPTEVPPAEDWLGERLQIMAEERERRRRFWSITVTVAIVAAAAAGLIIIFSMPSSTFRDGGLVEVNLGYGQLVRIPRPASPSAENVRSDNPDVFTMDVRWPGDGEYDEDLARISGGYYFARVTPQDEGIARLVVKARSGTVYRITVIVRKNKIKRRDLLRDLEKAGNTQLPPERRIDRARNYLERGNNLLRENPTDAIDAYNVALEYASSFDIELARKIEMKLEDAKKKAKERWKALRLHLTKARALRERTALKEALEEVKKLAPDPRDARHQWADILLEQMGQR